MKSQAGCVGLQSEPHRLPRVKRTRNSGEGGGAESSNVRKLPLQGGKRRRTQLVQEKPGILTSGIGVANYNSSHQRSLESDAHIHRRSLQTGSPPVSLSEDGKAG